MKKNHVISHDKFYHIAINIHVHAVSDYDGEAWQPIDSCRPNHGKPISHAPRPPYIIR